MRKSTFLQALSDTISLYLPFIKKSAGLLLGLFLLSEGLQHYFLFMSRLAQELQRSVNFVAITGQILTSLLEFVVLTMLVPMRTLELQKALPPTDFFAFTRKHIHGLTVESLRAMAMTLIWTLFFIVPGIFKYLRYMFVPYVVVAEPEYEQGQVDALEKSNSLVKGYTFQLLILMVIMTASELYRGSLRERYPLTTDPALALLVGVLFFAIAIFTNILLFRIYQLRLISWRASHGTDVQLEKH